MQQCFGCDPNTYESNDSELKGFLTIIMINLLVGIQHSSYTHMVALQGLLIGNTINPNINIAINAFTFIMLSPLLMNIILDF